MTLEKLIIECANTPSKRTEIFSEIAQQFLIPLHGRQLEEKTYEIFEIILKYEQDWKGFLLVPLFYRQDKIKSNYRDIWYTLKDYIAWCFLYPKEVDQYFTHEDNGTIAILENPKVRIIDKDYFKEVKKFEAGKNTTIYVKKEKSFKIDSGFTLEQKNSILSVIVAGLLTLPEQYLVNIHAENKKEKKVKKENVQ